MHIGIALLALTLSWPALADRSTGLLAIAYVESRNGQDMDHRRITKGMHAGHRAGGKWAIVPNTALFILKISRSVRAKYGHVQFMEPDQISDALTNNREMDRAFASALWNWLRDRFPRERAAYAWLRGWGAAAKASEAQIKACNYVQRFLAEFERLSEGK